MIATIQPWDAIWIFFILSSLQPLVQKHLLALGRRRMLAQIAVRRDATVITLIHRQETLSLLGFPLMRHIDIDDSESVLRASVAATSSCVRPTTGSSSSSDSCRRRWLTCSSADLPAIS